MNKAFLIGNLTRDPELSQTTSGIAFCRFSIAINRSYSSADGTKQVDYLPIICWRNQAENCGKFLKKGSKVGISGSIQTRSYEKDGEKRYVTEIVADEVEFLSTRGGYNSDPTEEDLPPFPGAGGGNTEKKSNKFEGNPVVEGKIPF